MAADRRSRRVPDFPADAWACLNPAHISVTWVNDLATCDACGLTSEMTGEFTAGTELARLHATVADLDGYIERRAAELAAPAIKEAERSAARFEERAADLREEFGRMVRHLESQLASARRRPVASAAAPDADARWSEAVDWLLNSRHAADPGIQRAFWGLADGELTREQADNGVFPELTDGTR